MYFGIGYIEYLSCCISSQHKKQEMHVILHISCSSNIGAYMYIIILKAIWGTALWLNLPYRTIEIC